MIERPRRTCYNNEVSDNTGAVFAAKKNGQCKMFWCLIRRKDWGNVFILFNGQPGLYNIKVSQIITYFDTPA